MEENMIIDWMNETNVLIDRIAQKKQLEQKNVELKKETLPYSKLDEYLGVISKRSV